MNIFLAAALVCGVGYVLSAFVIFGFENGWTKKYCPLIASEFYDENLAFSLLVSVVWPITIFISLGLRVFGDKAPFSVTMASVERGTNPRKSIDRARWS